MSCLDCKESNPARIQPEQCECPDLYYDDYLSSNCLECLERNPACVSCTLDKCTQCIHNREKPDQNSLECLCISERHMVTHSNTLWCTSKKLINITIFIHF